MKTFLLDVNAWIALAFESHSDNTAAARWLEEQGQARFAFCRTTQQGFLRLATNPKVPIETLTLPQAWDAYDLMLRDPRIIFMDEPIDLEQHWRAYTEDDAYSSKIWTDAYLAAFARAADLHLITFDGGFGRYNGLIYTHLA